MNIALKIYPDALFVLPVYQVCTRHQVGLRHKPDAVVSMVDQNNLTLVQYCRSGLLWCVVDFICLQSFWIVFGIASGLIFYQVCMN